MPVGVAVRETAPAKPDTGPTIFETDHGLPLPPD
jgi:hypothetical protein